MPLFLTRRSAILSLLAAAATATSVRAAQPIIDEIAQLEKRGGGRLGVGILDSATGALIAHRGDELFPMCSTFKLLAAGFVLQRVDMGEESLDSVVRYGTSDLVPNSPFTEKYAGGNGVSVGQLCKAAITLSDNAASNLLLARLGGPAGLTAFLRQIGDPVTRLDRIEPEMSSATPGDPRDTTSPNAMARTMQQLLFGDSLSTASKDQLARWLLENETGATRLRAGLPANWRIGDKTGASRNGVTNDIAFVQKPGGTPLIITVYLAESGLDTSGRHATIADVARAVVGHF